ncbi:hypothetical protein AB7282_09140 [Providencia huaxiensis]|uniref:hypothetical protein n=1 Tax=Providencia huaxiensis TaxID=2027290 RepID=UPI001E4E2F4E|nr:hypothetical protein [Providencia huaxiensis]MCD2526566.1 hypothetical protein [Providencia huaxiensis]
MILSLFLGALVCLILFLPTFFTIRNRGLNCRYLKKMKCKIFSFKKKKKLFLLDENSLQSQPLFWTVIALPLAIGVMLWAAIAYDYDLELTSDAYSRLMKNAQFPFVILALSPILGAFVMYGHRSLQTFTQIRATNKQIVTATEQLKEAQRKNKVDIYYADKKFKLEQLIKLRFRNEEININPHLLYDRFYHIIEPYCDEPNYEKLKFINEKLYSLNDVMKYTINVEISDFMMNPNCDLDREKEQDVEDFIDTIMRIQEINLTNKIILIYNEIIDLICLYEKENISTIYNNRYNNKSNSHFKSIVSLYKDTIDDFEEKYLYDTVMNNILYELKGFVLLISEVIRILFPTLDLKTQLPSIECCLETIKNRKDVVKLTFP